MNRFAAHDSRPPGDIRSLLHRARWLGGLTLGAIALTVTAFLLAERHNERVLRDSRVHVRLALEVIGHAMDRQVALRQFILTGDTVALGADAAASRRLSTQVDSLVAHVVHDPEQHARAIALRAAVDRWAIGYASPVVTRRIVASSLPQFTSLGRQDRELFEQVRAAFRALTRAERASDAARARDAASLTRWMTAALIVGLVLFAGILAHLARRTALQTESMQQLQQELLQAQKMEAIGRLAGGVAHDFNNLLTVMTSYADLVLDALDAGDPRRHDVEEIRRSAARAAALTRQLLAFSRQQVIAPTRFSLDGVVGEMQSMLRRLLPATVRLHVVRGDANPIVEADRGQIEQVVMNLVLNARDAMPAGGDVTIATSYDASNGRVVLSVSDTGIGMSAETRARIFEPFFTTREHGTGLGLATVHGIIHQAGGTISVESTPGNGTTFRIELPAAEGAVTRPTPEPGAASPLKRSGVILLAEDDDAVRIVTCRVLARQGYEVIEAKTGNEALAVLARENGRIRLVLTDMVMPGMGGAELAEALRSRRIPVPVILMSGYNRELVSETLQGGSQVAFLEKPFAPSELIARVRSVLEGAEPTAP